MVGAHCRHPANSLSNPPPCPPRRGWCECTYIAQEGKRIRSVQNTESITIAITMAGLATMSWSTNSRNLTQAQVFVGEETFLTNSKSRNRARSRTRWQGCLQGVYANTSSGFCGGRKIFDQQQITKSITIANTMAGLPT